LIKAFASRHKAWSRLLSIKPHLRRGSWATVEAVVAPALGIALSPWLLHKLGAEGFGQWALALTIAGFAHLASLGAGVATMYAAAARSAKDEDAEVADCIKAGFAVALIACIGLVFFAWLAAEPIATTLFSKMGQPRTVAVVLLLGVVGLALQELDAVFAGALRGMQRYDSVALLELVGRPIWALSIAIVAYQTHDVLAVLTVHLVYNLLKVIVRARIAAALLQRSCFGLPRSLQSMLDIVQFGKWISVQSLGGVLFSTMDKVLVGWFFGSADLARYSICLQVAQFVHGLQASGLQVITPWVTRNQSVWSPNIVKKKLMQICVYLGLGSLILPLLLLGGSWQLLALWLGASFADSNVNLLRVLLAGAAILAFTVPAHYVLLGLGRAKFSAILLLIAGMASLLASISLAAFGLMAFALGRITYGAIACFYLVPIRRFQMRSLSHDA